MPAWFEKFDPVAEQMISGNRRSDDPKNKYFPAFDNKHITVQLAFLATQNTTLFFCVELVHGQYYTQFQDGFLNVAGMAW